MNAVIDAPSGRPSSDQVQSRRGTLLSMVLLLIIVGNAIVIGWYALNGIAPHASLSLGEQFMLGAVPILNIAAGVGIWQRRRWGIYLWVAVSLLAPSVNWFAGVMSSESLPTAYVGSAIGIGIVALLVRRSWNSTA
jgi:hypothetical protein